MTKWKDLKVYHNLEPTEVPKAFKAIAHLLNDNLSLDGFRLKETKTLKRFFRFNNDFEQSIYFDNSSRWTKNQKDFKIFIAIKPLFTNPEIPFFIFQAFEVSNSFKMGYPITKEFTLLTEYLIQEIRNSILPFFDKYSLFEKVTSNYINLLNHYKIPNNGIVPINREAKRLVFYSAFRTRNKNLFFEFYNDFVKNGIIIEDLNKLRLSIEDDNLYEQAICEQNEITNKYITSFDKIKSSR